MTFPIAMLLELLLWGASLGAVALLIETAIERWFDRRSLWDRLPSSKRQMIQELMMSSASPAQIDSAIQRLVDDSDRGVMRWGTILAKGAPLLGLVGTLYGVSCSLNEFVRNSADPKTLVGGFSLAILTTMAGVFVSLLCLIITRWIRLPTLARWEHELHDRLHAQQQHSVSTTRRPLTRSLRRRRVVSSSRRSEHVPTN